MHIFCIFFFLIDFEMKKNSSLSSISSPRLVLMYLWRDFLDFFKGRGRRERKVSGHPVSNKTNSLFLTTLFPHNKGVSREPRARIIRIRMKNRFPICQWSERRKRVANAYVFWDQNTQKDMHFKDRISTRTACIPLFRFFFLLFQGLLISFIFICFNTIISSTISCGPSWFLLREAAAG